MGSYTEDDYNRRVIMTNLRKIRNDSSPMSVPPRGSFQAAFPTYYEYFVSKWTRKNRNISHIGAHHCPTPSSHTRSFLLPRPDVHTLHHDVTLCIPSTSCSLLGCAARNYPLDRTLQPFANNYPSLDHPNRQRWSRGGQKPLSILSPWSPFSPLSRLITAACF